MLKIKKEYCISCGKQPLSKDELGINKKLLGEDITVFYCLDCLALFLEVSLEDILTKIEEFKEDGCVFFK